MRIERIFKRFRKKETTMPEELAEIEELCKEAELSEETTLMYLGWAKEAYNTLKGEDLKSELVRIKYLIEKEGEPPGKINYLGYG